MKLKTLIKHLPIKRIQGDDVCEISGIHSDSRQISKGMLFVAVSGTTVDGHDYIGKAIEKRGGGDCMRENTGTARDMRRAVRCRSRYGASPRHAVGYMV